MELTDEIKRAISAALTEQTSTLVRAMIDTNKPIERRLDAVNEHLRELNGKVARHDVELGTGSERMNRFKEDIARIDRRIYDRRKDDIEKEESGENRKITMFHLLIVLTSISVTVAVLKFIGLLK